MAKEMNVAIVGAVNAVGSQIIESLQEREFPVGAVKYLGSRQSAGQVLEYGDRAVIVEELTRNSFKGMDIAFFSAGDDRSREFCPVAAAAGAVCIDSSAAWRMDSDVPLVVTEVNPKAVAGYAKKGIIAIPSSSTLQMLLAVKPLHDVATIKRIVVSTLQPVSDTGKKGVEELRKQVVDLLNGRPANCTVYPHQIAFNCLPQVGDFCDNGDTVAETMIIAEACKVMATDIRVAATVVRVPVFFGESQSVNIETEQPLSVAKARTILKKSPGIRLLDDPGKQVYPMPFNAAGQDLVCVGRIREDRSIDNGLNLWVVADNVRKGGVNAVQIAEILAADYLK